MHSCARIEPGRRRLPRCARGRAPDQFRRSTKDRQNPVDTFGTICLPTCASPLLRPESRLTPNTDAPHRRPLNCRGGSDPPASPASIFRSFIQRESPIRPAGPALGSTPHASVMQGCPGAPWPAFRGLSRSNGVPGLLDRAPCERHARIVIAPAPCVPTCHRRIARTTPAHCVRHARLAAAPCAAMRRILSGSGRVTAGRGAAARSPDRKARVLATGAPGSSFTEIRIGGVTISVPQTRHPRPDSSRTRGQSPGNPRLHLDHRPRFGYEAIYDRTALAASQPRRFIAKAQGES